MKYYKAMNKDFTCQDFQYEIGGIYELSKNVELELCKNGFHFCDILANCFNYYDIDSCIICEVEPLGKVIHDENENKLVTDKIKIVRQLSNEEIKKEQYVIQDGIEMVGDDCFYNCTGLKEITIPNSVTYIGRYVFCNCRNLESITIPNGVTYIEYRTFADCTSLKSITIPDSVTHIGCSVFNGCTNLKSITIPNSVTSISNCAFYNCTSLESITIPDGVTYIEYRTFEGCISLKSISILNAFNYIDEFAFYGCKNLEKIYVLKNFDINVFNTCIIDDNIKLLDQVEIVRI